MEALEQESDVIGALVYLSSKAHSMVCAAVYSLDRAAWVWLILLF